VEEFQLDGRMRRTIYLIISVTSAVVIQLSNVDRAFADWFQWVDSGGVLHLTDKLENIPESYREQASPLDIPHTPPPPEPESVSIPLKAEGQVAIVSALINGRTPADLIVDTGATYTVISYDMAGELQINVNENTPVTELQTANGVITAPVVELESVDVGGMKLSRVKAAVHDFSTARPVAGLLGLNFLKHFRVDIDTTAHTLHLQRREGEP
jgi:clan AA aspartic protease (TIGR02281 family)